MVKHSLRQLIANKVRLASMVLAIVLSVAFVAASFLLGDGQRSTLDAWANESISGFDLEAFTAEPADNSEPEPLDDQAVQRILSVEGVAAAQPQLTSSELEPAPAKGDLASGSGLEWATFGWIDNNGYTVLDGNAPAAADQFTIDAVTAERSGYVVGQSYDVTTPDGVRSMELTGLMQFGSTKQALEFPTIALQFEALQSLLDNPGYSSIRITLDSSVDSAEIGAAVRTAVPELEVLSIDELRSDRTAQDGQWVAEFQNILLGFGALSVFVSAFVIYNTFNVVLTQRTRELGLMRAIGASPRQLKRAMRVEALLIGAVSSVIGIVGGIGLSRGLFALLNATGEDLPSSDLVILPRTVIVCLVVGTVVTVLAAMIPARKACAVPPIAAIRDEAAGQTSTKRRLATGAAISIFGIGLAGFGLSGLGSVEATIAAMAGGGAAMFIGVTMLSPLGVDPVISVLRLPFYRFLGVPGNLAQGNTRRNQQRSATTAAALMIGLALVSMVLVVGQSVKNSQTSQAEQAFKGDYIFGEPGQTFGVDATLHTELEALDVVDQAVAVSDTIAQINSEEQYMAMADLRTLPNLIDIQLVEGTGDSASATDPILVSQEEATKKGIKVGDIIPAELENGDARDFTVIGLYKNLAGLLASDYLIDTKTWAKGPDELLVSLVVMSAVDGTSNEEFLAATQAVVDNYPGAEGVGVRTIDGYLSEIDNQVDQLLVLVNAMMLLAVLIAVLGIANTLALSIFERTTEIGLLRAVGMKRRQLRQMIRYEAILLSLFGAILGVLLGIGFGAASVVALPASIATLALPFGNIALLVVCAGVAGLLAAILPARRAARMNPLDAIAS